MKRTDYDRFIYKFVGGRYNRMTYTYRELKDFGVIAGYSENASELRRQGCCVHREELDDQPIVDGYVGPMYDGTCYGVPVIRYETQEVYDLLSE